MKRPISLFALACGVCALAQATSAQTADLGSVFSAPIGIERQAPVASVPLEVRGGKLFLQASIDGNVREFIFDTGSPTILARGFAETLGLEIIGSNTGTDANGTPVTMDVAIVDSLEIGDATFRNVPVLVFDFASLPIGPCIFDGGVIGSEILRGSAWRIDTGSNRLSIAESAAAFGNLTPVIRAQLHDFGYPHAPILDYSIGDFSDRALFDTGNAEQVTLFRDVFDHRETQQAIVAGSLRRGRGSEGTSAGGSGEIGDIIRYNLSDLKLDGQSLGELGGTVRQAPPTLIGARILESHIVTLDYPGGEFLLEPRTEPEGPRIRPDFGIAFEGGTPTVSQLLDGTAASTAGLRLGDQVAEIDGRSLAVSENNDQCDVARWLMQSFDAGAAVEIVVIREGQRQTITIGNR